MNWLMCASVMGQQPDEALRDARFQRALAEKVIADTGFDQAGIQAKNVQVRVALHRIQNEHFVAGHSVHMRGHGLVGPFSIEVVERPYLARAGTL